MAKNPLNYPMNKCGVGLCLLNSLDQFINEKGTPYSFSSLQSESNKQAAEAIQIKPPLGYI